MSKVLPDDRRCYRPLVPAPDRRPIGLQLAATAKDVGRAFDEALAAAGGSRPTWLLLLQLKLRGTANQRELAEAVGIRGATASHHLDAMETAGLLTRRRHPDTRRTHIVELTPAGDEAFHRLRAAAADFDARLRAGVSETEVALLADLLARLAGNVRT